jgi:F-type H+-transporting ATPase subunit delta
MTNRTAADRYARALLEVAVREKGDVQAIERELAGFSELLADHPTLEKVLTNPAVPVQRKHAAVAELLKSIKPSTVVGKLFLLLADRDRLVLLPDLVAAYRERLLDHLKVVRAEVTTAMPLAPAAAKAVEQRLASITGRTVTLDTKVDRSIVGGVVARIGSTVYDGSVMTQMRRMKEKLLAGG